MLLLALTSNVAWMVLHCGAALGWRHSLVLHLVCAAPIEGEIRDRRNLERQNLAQQKGAKLCRGI